MCLEAPRAGYPCFRYVDVLEASRWPSVRPAGGATITVSPPSRPPLTSTPCSNSRPVRIGTLPGNAVAHDPDIGLLAAFDDRVLRREDYRLPTPA